LQLRPRAPPSLHCPNVPPGQVLYVSENCIVTKTVTDVNKIVTAIPGVIPDPDRRLPPQDAENGDGKVSCFSLASGRRSRARNAREPAAVQRAAHFDRISADRETYREFELEGVAAAAKSSHSQVFAKAVRQCLPEQLPVVDITAQHRRRCGSADGNRPARKAMRRRTAATS
jgi:hypothetical protein